MKARKRELLAGSHAMAIDLELLVPVQYYKRGGWGLFIMEDRTVFIITPYVHTALRAIISLRGIEIGQRASQFRVSYKS